VVLPSGLVVTVAWSGKRVQIATLGKAPFKGRATRKGRLTTRKGKLVARASIRGRKLTLTLAPGVKAARLKGTYMLKVSGRKAVKVRLR